MTNHKLLNEVRLWPNRYGIPSNLEYKVLQHLARPGEPRLYIQTRPGYSDQVSVSNTAHEPGWSTLGSVESLFRGCHYDRRPWIEFDKEITKKVSRSIKVYKINAAGYEAMAQYRARRRYQKEHLELARRILAEERKKVQALTQT